MVNTLELFTKYLRYISRSVEEITPEEFKVCINKASAKLDIDKQKELLNQWEILQSENSYLRVLKEGKVISVSKDYFDKDILKFAEKKLIKVIRVIGSAAGNSEIGISDFYMRSRVKKLMDVLDIKIIAEKTGLSEEKIKNL